jgi:hypothetical protein
MTLPGKCPPRLQRGRENCLPPSDRAQEENSKMPDANSLFFALNEEGEAAVKTYTVLDVEAVPVEDAGTVDDDCVKSFILDRAPQILHVDIAIAGGGMGGIAAALALGPASKSILTEETSWLGGQLSAQGVCALDENKYVETTGACQNYLQFRQDIRQAYRDTGKLTAVAEADPLLNPGTCWVTRLAFEPEVALPLLDSMLEPQVKSGALTIMKRTKIVDVALEEDSAKIKALLAVDLDTGKFYEIHCAAVIDATELGDLMPMAKVPYSTGSDSRWVTGEAFAPESPNAENVQDFTYPFVLEYHQGENHTIKKPSDYETFLAAGKFSFDGYKMFREHDENGEDGDATGTGKKRHLLPFWTYRRLIDRTLFKPGTYKSDVSMINWDSNDLRGKNIIDKSPLVQKQYLSLAKRVSLGFLYWLQTTAPRDDSTEIGYPELKLSYDVLGTTDGLSKYPYIREARRLAARLVVVAQDIVEGDNPEARATLFPDSCGIGLYPVDIHGHQEIPGAAQQTKPFQVPLSALVSDYCPNYIAGCKNIGVTHITNGAYRLHPIEWAIGTAAGALARLAHRDKTVPLNIVDQFDKTLLLQIALAESGAPLFWFDDLKADHPAFAAAHVLAASGLLPVASDNLSFQPDATVSSDEVAHLAKNLSERMLPPNIWESTVPAIAKQTAGKRGEFVRAVLEKVKLELGILTAESGA